MTQRIDVRVIFLLALYSACADWIVLCDRLRDRLETLEQCGSLGEHSEWRREIPTWLEHIKKTLEEAIPTAIRLATDPGTPDNGEPFADIIDDFEAVQSTLIAFQARVDRLEASEVGRMQLAAASESVAESHNLARLTWLAAIFISTTIVSGLFSMTESVSGIIGTFKIYFMVALPLGVGSLNVAQWGSSAVRYIMSQLKEPMRWVMEMLRIGRMKHQFWKKRRGVRASKYV